jgi:erythromycin esterase
MMNDESLRDRAPLAFIIHHSAFIICILVAFPLLAKQHAIRGETPSAWLHAHAIPLASVEPSADDSDLAPLLPVVADARVIALGDATHGTHEFFSVKERLIPFFVKRANVRTIVFEAPYGEIEAINDYVRTGAGDPSALLHIDNYFFWDADEVLDTIRWVRAWNAAGNPPVEVAGADAFHTQTTIARVLSLLDGDARAEAEKDYACVANITISTAQWYRDACRASVMSVRPLLESHHIAPEIVHAARIAEQGEESLERDSAMAENIEWLADRAGTGNFIVWGHNEHFGKTPTTLNDPNGLTSAGTYLAERYGAGYVSIGTIALRGTFNASELSGGDWIVGQYPMLEASPDDFATTFASASMPRMIVPLRGALPSWLALPHPIRVAGSNVASRTQTTVAVVEEIAKKFDALIYVESTTATRLRP